MSTDSEERPSVDQAPFSGRSEDARPVAFFRAVSQAFQQAEQVAGGQVDRYYTIGDHTIRLRFAGPALVPFVTPALAHLAAGPDQPPALTVRIWDSASTHTQMPPPPWNEVDYDRGGEIWRFSNERFSALFQPDVSIMNMLDSEKNQAIYWICDCRDLRFYEKASPLRTLLYWWMGGHDRQMVHAAATGNSKGGVLIAGKGGSGKSSTSLVCLHSGLLYVGDNYVLLSQDPTPFAHSLYNSCTLHAPHMHQRFPWLVAKTSNREKLDAEKALLFLHEHYPESVATRVPIKAILLPEITHQSKTRLRRISPAQSLVSLAPSSMFILPAAGEEDFRYMASFVRRVPSYVLELGTDLTAIPGEILGLLSRLGNES